MDKIRQEDPTTLQDLDLNVQFLEFILHVRMLAVSDKGTRYGV